MNPLCSSRNGLSFQIIETLAINALSSEFGLQD